MSLPTQHTTHDLWNEGRQLELSMVKPTPTTIQLTWKLPETTRTYAGQIVLLAEEPFNVSHFPVDGTRYVPSTNWAAPADKIGTAQVVAAAYGFFGDDLSVVTVTVTGIDPNKLYYASVHATSNILQYYTIGSQSYPLEASRIEKNSASYAGSIPTAKEPPANPFDGQAYYDDEKNEVFVWNSQIIAWVKSNQATIPVGTALPISQYQLFFNRVKQRTWYPVPLPPGTPLESGVLEFFDGTAWIECTNANTRVKMGAAWVPFAGTSVSATYPTSPAVGSFTFVTTRAPISAPSGAELKLFSLGSWYHPTSNLVQVFNGVTWQPVQIGNDLWGNADPSIPSIGDFFYDTTNEALYAWSGSEWIRADTDSQGTPITDKVGVGTDGTYDERLRLITILKGQLGWPQVCVELAEEQFNIAIDNALDEARRRLDNAYDHRFISFTIKKGQNTYYLNDPRDKTNRIVNIIKIHRINMLGISSLSAETGLYAQAFYNQLYQGSHIDILGIHLMHQLSEQFERIFAGNITFTWDESSRQLMLLRRVHHDEERVVLEVVMERTEQELLLDRWMKQWIQGWAQAELWEMLGEIRSKYGSLPGAAGGLTLNGDALIARAETQFNELLRQVNDYEVGNGGVNWQNTAFMIG